MSGVSVTASGMLAGVRNRLPSAGLPTATGPATLGRQCRVEQHASWREIRKHRPQGAGPRQTSTVTVTCPLGGRTVGRVTISGVKVRQPYVGSAVKKMYSAPSEE